MLHRIALFLLVALPVARAGPRNCRSSQRRRFNLQEVENLRSFLKVHSRASLNDRVVITEGMVLLCKAGLRSRRDARCNGINNYRWLIIKREKEKRNIDCSTWEAIRKLMTFLDSDVNWDDQSTLPTGLELLRQAGINNIAMAIDRTSLFTPEQNKTIVQIFQIRTLKNFLNSAVGLTVSRDNTVALINLLKNVGISDIAMLTERAGLFTAEERRTIVKFIPDASAILATSAPPTEVSTKAPAVVNQYAIRNLRAYLRPLNRSGDDEERLQAARALSKLDRDAGIFSHADADLFVRQGTLTEAQRNVRREIYNSALLLRVGREFKEQNKQIVKFLEQKLWKLQTYVERIIKQYHDY